MERQVGDGEAAVTEAGERLPENGGAYRDLARSAAGRETCLLVAFSVGSWTLLLPFCSPSNCCSSILPDVSYRHAIAITAGNKAHRAIQATGNLWQANRFGNQTYKPQQETVANTSIKPKHSHGVLHLLHKHPYKIKHALEIVQSV